MTESRSDNHAPDFKVVTVFGGAGFIGRHLVRRLAKRGWRVIVATRRPAEAMFLKPLGSVGQIVPMYADITDDASVEAAVRTADFAINLVGILYEPKAGAFEKIHAEAPGRIARLAKAAGCERMVQISAIGADTASDSAYARTKAKGEQAVLAAFPEATILRPSIVFGPEDGFFNLFAGMAQMSPILPLIGGGHTRFQPVYVGDVADAAMAALQRLDVFGRTYELGGPQAYSFRELMEMMLKEIRRKRFLMTVPWPLAELQGKVLGMLPSPPLTSDQVTQLKHDNVVSDGALTLKDLDIQPTALEAILPTYMIRFRPGGRFASRLAG
jgi:NADH dehydrogenase